MSSTQTLRVIARELLKPKAAIFLVSFVLFLHVPYRFGPLCLYNWSNYWGLTFLLTLSALALWLGKPWSYAAALFLSFSVFKSFLIWALKIHGFLQVSAADARALPWKTPEEWWMWVLTERSYEFIPPGLAFVVFCYATFCLMVALCGKRAALQ